MSEKTTTSSGGGIGFAGLLAIVFITLKLTHVIDWSWWWVLAPLWLGLAIVLGIAIIGVACVALFGFLASLVAAVIVWWKK